ncbi:unnamed protein product [Phytophthora fragariaefolia]|uniref:Unnamed protein product n=1 Tax=Phytophthora fragariaefolia TaxID=1490495 RepID=A0A9W6YG49_9STRA|nr:unnamed protein product [Phytophthora fragariaefolia]
MKIVIPSILLLAGSIAFVQELVMQVAASRRYVAMMPNGANVTGFRAIGHPDGTGRSAATNNFGKAFANVGYAWTKEFCMNDTDGDGQTNGQELGDPCCQWNKTSNPVYLSPTNHHPFDYNISSINDGPAGHDFTTRDDVCSGDDQPSDYDFTADHDVASINDGPAGHDFTTSDDVCSGDDQPSDYDFTADHDVASINDSPAGHEFTTRDDVSSGDDQASDNDSPSCCDQRAWNESSSNHLEFTC